MVGVGVGKGVDVFVGEGVLVAWGKVINGAYTWASGVKLGEDVLEMSGAGVTVSAVPLTSIG
jgi:hypothetical protein